LSIPKFLGRNIRQVLKFFCLDIETKKVSLNKEKSALEMKIIKRKAKRKNEKLEE